jgi:hypothetical protein
MTEPLIIWPDRRKLLLLVLGSAGFVAIGIWLASGGAEGGISPWKRFAATWLGIPFFGFAGCYGLYRLLRPQPALLIDEAGITDRSTASAAGLIRWEEIDHLKRHEYMGQPMLGIVLKDFDGFAGRLSPGHRAALLATRELGIPAINIPRMSVGIELDELEELLRSRCGARRE